MRGIEREPTEPEEHPVEPGWRDGLLAVAAIRSMIMWMLEGVEPSREPRTPSPELDSLWDAATEG